MDTLALPARHDPGRLLPVALVRVVLQPSRLRAAWQEFQVPQGTTLLQILLLTPLARRADGDVIELAGDVVIEVGDETPYQSVWHTYRPRANRLVCIYVAPEGARQALLIGGMVAITALAIAAPYALPALLPGVAGAGLLGVAAGAAISIGGYYALNTFLPYEQPDDPVSSAQTVNVVTSQSNRVERYARVPVVMGTMRVTPNVGAVPYTEPAGSDLYLHVLLFVGQGPLAIDQIKVGETAIEDLSGDIDYEIRQGRTSEAALTLFTRDATEIIPAQALGELFSHTPQVQTTAPNTGGISLDIEWPRGIYHQGKVNRDPYAVVFTIEISPAGTGSWTDFVTGSGSLTHHTERHETNELIRRTYKRNLPSEQYDIRLKRINGDSSESNPSSMFWSALRSFQPHDPRPDKTIACIALRVKKTGSASVPPISCRVRSYALNWNGVAWIEAITNNPASLGRHLLQGSPQVKPVGNDRIDLPSWEDFHEYCGAEGWSFNGVFDDERTTLDRIRNVLAAGRGRLIMPEGKYGVAIDKADKPIVGTISPRNSFDFKGKHWLSPELHALRCLFFNEAKNYQPDERLVLEDGIVEEDVDDGKVEILDLTDMGITNTDQVWRIGRYRLAERRLRPGIYSVKQGKRAKIYVPGDIVAFQSDIPLLGLGGGRIKTLNYGTAVFADEFNTLSLDTGQDGGETWVWRFVEFNTSLLTANGDEAFKVWSGYNPGGGGQTPAAMGVVLHEASGGTLKLYGRQNPNQTGYPTPYLGGMINSELSQSHQYGVWEIRARFTASKGHKWAIWFTATGESGPSLPEIDLLEIANDESQFAVNRFFMNSHGTGQAPFTETWTGANGAVWPTARWAAATVQSTSIVDIQGNQGRVVAQGANYVRAKIFSLSPQFANFDATVTFTLGSTGEQYHYFSFRSDGAWSSNPNLDDQPANGYAVQIIPTGLNLYAYVNSVRTLLDTGGPGGTLGTSAWTLRVRARGKTLQARIWQGTEPSNWHVEASHTGSTAGTFAISTTNGDATTARQILWDNLTVTGLPATHVMHANTVPASEVTGLSPYIQVGDRATWRDWHVWRLVRTADTIEWWLDGILRMSSDNYFTQPIHIMVSPEIGGLWEKDPDASTVWPAVAEIDYIRFFEGSVSSVTLDADVTMEVGKTYQARATFVDDAGVDQFLVRAVHNDASGVLFTETWTGANGAAWSTARWNTADTQGAGSTVDIQANAGRLLATGEANARARIIAKSGSLTDFDLTAQVTIATGNQTAQNEFHSLNFRANGAWSATAEQDRLNGYSFEIRTSSGTRALQLVSVVNSTRTVLGGPIAKAWGTSAWSVRVQCIGTALKAKMWQGSEPAGWDIEVTNAVHTSGDFSFATVTGADTASRTATWDNLTVQSLVNTQQLRFVTPFPAGSAPSVGDEILFGETSLSDVRCVIRDILPGPEDTAEIILIDEAPGIFQATEGPIPPWDSQITLPLDFYGTPPAVPVISNIVVRAISHPSQPDVISQQQVIVQLRQSGSSLQPPTGFEVEIKRADQAVYQRRYSFPPDAQELVIDVVQSDTLYDVRARALGRSPRGLRTESAWSVVKQIFVPLPQVTFATVARVAGLELQGQGNDTTFEGPDANFAWRLTSISGAFQIHDTGQQLVQFVDPQFAWYEVSVIDPATSYERRVVPTTTPHFVYSIADNKEDSRKQSAALGGSKRPLRQFTVRVHFVDRFGRKDAGQVLTVENPAPPVPTGIIVSGKILAINVKANRPDDDDLDGLRIFVGNTSGFNPAAPSTLRWETTDNVTTLIPDQPGGVTKFLRIAHADRFSEEIEDLNLSSEIAVVIEAPDGPPRFTAEGIIFKPNGATNVVSWTAGTVHVLDGSTLVSEPVSAGQASWTSGTTLWLYYVRGFGAIQATTNAAAANQPDRVALAQYRGGRRLTRTTGDIPIANLVTIGGSNEFNGAGFLGEPLTIVTAGNPVDFTVTSRVSTNGTVLGTPPATGDLSANISFARDGTTIRTINVAFGRASNSQPISIAWAGDISVRDVPAAGTHTYRASVSYPSNNMTSLFSLARFYGGTAQEALY